MHCAMNPQGSSLVTLTNISELIGHTHCHSTQSEMHEYAGFYYCLVPVMEQSAERTLASEQQWQQQWHRKSLSMPPLML
eukprot:6172388-Pleurochrysis_carterae.AAC.6